jgi:hypothetical protein
LDDIGDWSDVCSLFRHLAEKQETHETTRREGERYKKIPLVPRKRESTRARAHGQRTQINDWHALVVPLPPNDWLCVRHCSTNFLFVFVNTYYSGTINQLEPVTPSHEGRKKGAHKKR